MNYLNLLTRPITVTLQSNPIFAIELLIVIMVCVLYYMCMAAVNTLNNAANYARNKKHYKQYQNQSGNFFLFEKFRVKIIEFYWCAYMRTHAHIYTYNHKPSRGIFKKKHW